ncbi:unnamed protein product [Lymnaea stagnalis]|uniref:Uncharacterized protein n=1 Tax=Lymnaea stagnalis TaxID=6523 RepID=A0AAV2H0D4_LYMST
MAAPMITQVDACFENVNQISDEKCDKNVEHSTKLSSQLLYPEKFSDCYQEKKLLIVGKDAAAVPKGQLRTVCVPPSSVLSRLKEFLPQISNANKDMASQISSCPDNIDKFDIENISGTSGHHIEMNLSMIPAECLEDSEDDSISDSEGISESESNSEENINYVNLIKLMTPEIKIAKTKDKTNKKGFIEEIGGNMPKS